ncbi:hypothetical protein ACFVUY_38085 [Kitasatospora sp. NPDC058063]|uniref:hypothetical protein n=1 Tax=unclassified Kitasatospora TaxID=2633591 RepID=UPI0036DC6398
MITPDPNEEYRALLRRTKELAPGPRLVLTLYKAMPKDRTTGAVRLTAKALAGELGWTESQFSKARTVLIDGGWLEAADRYGNVRIFRLTDKALGTKSTVVPLRPVG